MMRKAIALTMALVVTGAAGALEVKDGLIKIVLHEDSGRFSAYYLADVAKGRYEALVFDRDPRTSSTNVYIDGILYRMGESTEFRIGSRRNGSGAEFVFKSSFCTVTQNFNFMKSRGSSLSDGLIISITISNTSTRDYLAGLRVILDTHLGENSSSHFSTNIRQRISNETMLDSRSADEWLVSASTSGGIGTLLPLPASGLLKADRIVLANWSRLNSSAWNYEYSQSRNFTLQPYSINDSAVSLEWDAAVLPSAKSIQYSFVIAGFSGEGGRPAMEASSGAKSGPIYTPSDASQASADASSAEQISVKTEEDAKRERQARLRTDFMAVKEILERIDAIIASGAEASQADIEEMRAAIEDLKSRRNSY